MCKGNYLFHIDACQLDFVLLVLVGPFGCSWLSSRGNGCRTGAHKCSFRFNAPLRVSHLFEQEQKPF